LVNNGILPLQLCDEADYEALEQGEALTIENARAQVEAAVAGAPVVLKTAAGREIRTQLNISDRQAAMLLAGGLLNATREQAK
ncbi:MAG: aconitate hydratase, partial [Clostridia bacterium]|nr:aconitate hydratase [Clostridia bacterium]